MAVTLSFVKGINIKKNKNYKEIISGKNELHHYGSLYFLLKNIEQYKNTTFCIVRHNGKPICIVSAIKCNNKNQICNGRISIPLVKYFSLQFPCYELMAFTLEKYRKKGYCSKALEKILQKIKAKNESNIYVYSRSMERLIHRLGYSKTKNIHEHTI